MRTGLPFFLLSALVAGIFFGELGAMMMPFQIGSFIDGLDFSESKAGFVGSVETMTLGITMLAVSLGIVRSTPRRMAIIGIAMAAAGQLLTGLTDAFPVILFARFTVGLGSALCQSAAVMTIASLKNPDSTTGFVYAYVILLLALLVFLVPWVLPYGYHRALFSLFAALTVLAIPLISRLPDKTIETNVKARESRPADFRAIIFLFIVGEVFLLVGFGSVWSFIERIGLVVGLTANAVGLALSLGMLVSVTGSYCAGRLGVNRGRKLPLVAGAVISAVACGAVPLSTSFASYLLLMFLFQFMLSFVLPYVVGTSAVIDKSGRVATAAFAVQIMSYGISSTLAGIVYETYSMRSLAIIGIAGPVIAAFFFWVVCNKLAGYGAGRTAEA